MRITILHIEAGRHLYGGAQQVLYLLQGLENYPVNNILLTHKDNPLSEQAPAVKKYLVDFKGDLDFRWYFYIKKIIQENNIDIIHVHSRKGVDFWVGLLAKNIPAIISRRVDNKENPFVARFKYHNYRYIIGISQAIVNILKSYSILEQKLLTIHSAIDSKPWQIPCDKDFFYQKFQCNPNAFTLAIIAQLIPRKGHNYLLQALPQVLEHYPNLQVLFFGKGKSEQTIINKIKALQLENNVKLLGFYPYLTQVLPCLDILIHPATKEGLGVILLQAASVGLPIIAGNSGGIPEVVKDQYNGILINPLDSNALAKHIIELLQQPILRKTMAENGRKHIAENFSVEIMVKKYYKLYEKIIL